MHFAAQHGHLDIVKFVAEYSEDKNPTDENGFTPLNFARENGHLEIVNYFERSLRKRCRSEDDEIRSLKKLRL